MKKPEKVKEDTKDYFVKLDKRIEEGQKNVDKKGKA
jgi:hypothetical protein